MKEDWFRMLQETLSSVMASRVSLSLTPIEVSWMHGNMLGVGETGSCLSSSRMMWRCLLGGTELWSTCGQNMGTGQIYEMRKISFECYY